MAELVLGLGVPHTPYFPTVVEKLGRISRVAVLFEEVRQRLEAAAPDLLIVLTSDHFVGFFYDNMPTFCVGMLDEAEGPHENARTMPWYRVKGDREFAYRLLEFGLDSGFDLASSEELRLDHSLLVPLHFLTPSMDIPVVPVYIKGLAQPLPKAERCYDLGKMVRGFINRWPENRRVAVLASGSFSLEVGGPKMGWIDEEWVDTVVDLLRRDNPEELVRRATASRMLSAGNTGAELLNWIALLGVLDRGAPSFIESDVQPPEDPRDAHAYAVWEMRRQ